MSELFRIEIIHGETLFTNASDLGCIVSLDSISSKGRRTDVYVIPAGSCVYAREDVSSCARPLTLRFGGPK